MGQRTSYPPGTFSWAELHTSDATGAKEFYGALFGWDFEDIPIADDNVYTMAHLDGGDAAAILNVVAVLARPVPDFGGVHRRADPPAGPTCGATRATRSPAHLAGMADVPSER